MKFFRPEPKSGTCKLPRCWNIKHTKSSRVLGARVCENILFGHALLGCDTTSRVFGIGKGALLIYSCRHCLRHLLQLDTIEFTTKYRDGEDFICHQLIGVRNFLGQA